LQTHVLGDNEVVVECFGQATQEENPFVSNNDEAFCFINPVGQGVHNPSAVL
jgi:hypothetical protein